MGKFGAILLRIPIFIFAVTFILSWIADLYCKTSSAKIFNKYFTTGLLLVSLLIHIIIVSNDVYSLDILMYNFDTGFLKVHTYTRTIAFISFLYTVISLVAFAPQMLKFVLLMCSGIYSISFASNALGIEVSVFLYMLGYLSIYCSFIKDQKSIDRVIFGNILGYMLIAYGLQTTSITSIAIGIILHLQHLPTSPRLHKLSDDALKYLAILNSIALFMSVVMLIIISSQPDFIGIEIPNFLWITPLAYGGIYAILESSWLKSAVYFNIFLSGVAIFILCQPNLDRYAVLNYLVITCLAWFLVTICLQQSSNNSLSAFNKYLIMACITLMSGVPFISPVYSQFVMSKGMPLINSLIFDAMKCLVVIYGIKVYNIIKTQELSKQDGMTYIKTGLLLFIILASVMDSFGLALHHVFSSAKSDISAHYAIITTGSTTYVSWIVASYILKDKYFCKQIATNYTDIAVFKFINSISGIYDMVIIYFSSLLRSINSMAGDDVKIFKNVLKQNSNNKARIAHDNTIVSILIIIGLALFIKIFI